LKTVSQYLFVTLPPYSITRVYHNAQSAITIYPSGANLHICAESNHKNLEGYPDDYPYNSDPNQSMAGYCILSASGARGYNIEFNSYGGGAHVVSLGPKENKNSIIKFQPDMGLTETTTYTVTFSSIDNPAITASATITVYPSPDFTLTSTDDRDTYNACGSNNNTPLTLSVTPPTDYHYWWFPTDGLNTIAGSTVNAAPLKATTYYAIGIDKTTGCYNNADNFKAITYNQNNASDGDIKIWPFRNGTAIPKVKPMPQICADANDHIELRIVNSNFQPVAPAGATR